MMDNEYIYRLDYTEKLKTFPDRCHRAPRWYGGENSFPHELLTRRLSQLNSSQAIYRICFFSTQAKAEEARLTYRDEGTTTTLARCRKSDLLTVGFTDSWDDGFNPGVAHLFWIEEDLADENCALSTAAIPFERFEALIDGHWMPLASHLAPAPNPVRRQAEHVEKPRANTSKPSLLSRLRFFLGSM